MSRRLVVLRLLSRRVLGLLETALVALGRLIFVALFATGIIAGIASLLD